MDMYIIAISAILFFIIAAAVSLVMKKSALKILGIALTGLVLGAASGYLLAPFIISFL